MNDNFVKFERNEDKYIISGVLADRIKREVARRMQPSYPNPMVKFTLIASTYFDNSELTLYRAYLDRANERFKIRIRVYGNNGEWNNNDKYLELKENELGKLNKKARMKLFSDDSSDFLQGSTKGFMAKITSAIAKNNLIPMIQVTYRREAFQTKDGFRVTFDTELGWNSPGPITKTEGINWAKAVHFGEKYNSSTDTIMEVKHNGEPKWFKDLVKAEGIQPTPFSKYACAIYGILRKQT